MDSRSLLQKQAEAWKFSLSDDKLDGLMNYADLLESYEFANVIGTRDHYRIVTDHILDSLSCLLTGLITTGHGLVDVGAGGGLPGIPLQIATAQLKVTLVESTGKKVRFLEHAIDTLGLDEARVFHGRVEEYGRSVRHAPPYGLATARALAPLPVLIEYCLPLLEVGGHLIAMKARLGKGELRAGRLAAAMLEANIEEIVHVPHLWEIGQRERRLVIIKKTHPTPAEYPRRVGLAKSHPLGTQKV